MSKKSSEGQASEMRVHSGNRTYSASVVSVGTGVFVGERRQSLASPAKCNNRKKPLSAALREIHAGCKRFFLTRLT